ncbi:hypothetical protein WMY93_031670 [Mugilogobius chulae]|uniref:B box-type domain-containing protein n=1 Tax=Mugilogobius chulae TaxID=88201 RepID=A0AAW0MD85_9GOBI
MKGKRSNSMEEKPTFQCDVCSEPKLKALKSCLVCLSSFCETHLQPHLTVSGLKKHQLMEPVGNLEDRLCPEHQRPLELFCHTDEKIVCLMCSVLEHKSHELLSLEAACERRRSSLLHTQAHTQHMIKQRRPPIARLCPVVHSCTNNHKPAQTEVCCYEEDVASIFTPDEVPHQGSSMRLLPEMYNVAAGKMEILLMPQPVYSWKTSAR